MKVRWISSSTFNIPVYKIASASLTDDICCDMSARRESRSSLSTGMSTYAEIDHAVEVLGKEDSF